MNRKEILLICLILCFICSLQAVASADVSVDDTHDVKLVASSVAIDNDLSSYSHSENSQILRGENDDAGSFSDLQNKINSESGTTITLDKNYTFNESLLTDIALASSGIVVQKDSTLTIVGQAGKNITINGLGDSKLFSFKSHVILQNINFINGVGHKTSSITSDDMLVISDCRFFDNTGKLGGAIQANDGLTVTDSIFEGNLALDGGSIYVGSSDKTSIIENCNFTDSKATTGDAGCIYSNSAHLTLRNLNITDAAAALNGGAMVLNGENTVLDHLYIANCRATNGGAMYYTKAPKQSTYLTFIKNHAFSDGGAVYLLADSTGNGMASGLVNSTFIENIANNEGGALYLVGSNGYMFNVTFKKNTGTIDGGAVMVKGSNWRVYNCTFDTNKVNNRHGGAIYLDSSAGTQIWYCNFTSNEASYDGGAVYLYDSSKTTIAYSNFTTNKAGHGGGAVYCNFNSDNSTLTQSRFISNAAYAGDGGGIYWDGNRGDITWSTFRYNRVEGSVGANTGFGGGLAISGIYTNASNCIFEYNHANVGGGGCAVKDSDVSSSSNITVRDSIFEHNAADRDAGGLCWNDNSPYGTAINCTFRYNYAKGSAGAIGWHSDYGKLYNSTLEHNYATGQFGSEHPGHGGAMVFRGDHNFAYNCTFYNNTAAKDGGAVYMKLTQLGSNTNITFELCRFINNTANNNGGALAWEAGSTYGNVTQCNFTNNTALRSGGAILWEGTYGFIEYSNFTSNKATGDVIDAIGGGDAGVILWIGSHGYVNHCNFTDNFAAYRGGAVFLKGSTNTTFNDTLFRFNVAGTNGGAIDWQEGSHDGRLLNSVFINNTAWRSAGAVYWFGTNGTIYNSNFTNNTAVGNVTVDDRKAAAITYSTVGGNGGAVVWTGSIGNVTKVNFEFNYAERLGGAMFLVLNDNVTISYANFTNNTAGINGGAVDWYKGATNGTVKHSNFINNTAKRSGGAIYWYGHDGTLYNITFKYNKALGNASYINPFGENTTGGDGGAVFWTGYNGNVTLSKFINNTAVKRGGAVFLQGATDYYCNNTQFKSVLFENNTAGTNGGAVDWFKGATHGVIDNATFRNNVANRSGGAVYWNGDYGDILNSNFTNNRALGITWAINAYGENTTGGSGGAIIWSGSHGIVNNSRFINNTAARHGGAVYMQGTSEENCTNTTYDLCYFEGNNATINGGALDWHENAHEGLVMNSYFINNRAGANGGAVFWLGHDGNITHSNFTYNYALGNVADDYQNQGDGGAVIWGGLNGYVDDCWFKFNNASARGGAVYIHSCEHGNNNTHFTNSHFINNTAGTNGGAIDWHAGAENGTVSKTEFINNTAHVNGGAIYWNGINGSIIDSNFTNNSAYQNGGAVYWEGNQGLINGSIFKYNNATGYLNSSRIVNYHNDNTGIDEVHYDILGGDGGAIIWKGSQSKIENSTFYKNYAPYRGGAIFFTSLGTENCENVTIKDSNFTLNAAGMNGGAVDWAKGAYNATILSSYFNNNTAGRSAGAIYVSGNDLDIEDTEFNYNKVTGETKYDNRTNVSNYTSIGGNGGAICWMGSYGDLDNVTFLNNTATQRGGAIQFEQNKNTTIENSRFINNTAGTEGGAIDFYKGAVNGKIINSNFTNNAAYENGGAIYWEGHYGTINSTRFENNKVLGLGDGVEMEENTNPDTGAQLKHYNITGGDGGAIKWTGSHGIIENTTFYNNVAEYNGGAVYLIGNATENCTNITFIDCNFTLNLAKLNGGAVYWAKGSSNATVNGTYFDNNTAKRSAGAIYISGDYLNIKDTQFRFNNATMEQTYDNRTGAGFFSSEGGNAGAICWMGSYGTVDNGTFINNTAFKRGGAIQFERNQEGTVKNSYFENNTAGSDGGAIDWYQGAVNGQLVNSTFRTNHVSDSNARGSAVYIEGYNATIRDSRFYEHNSITDGGAVYIEGDEASVKNTTFENINTAKKGGAIFVTGDNATISESNFTNVRADVDGGAIYIEGKNTTISGSKFNNTSSIKKGGAIYVDGRNASIIESRFINSTSRDSDGGALYVIGVECKLYNSTFDNNTAADDGGAIYWQGNNGKIYNITCTNNSANSIGTHHSKGGTICLTSNYTSVDKSHITDSFVSYNGGAMFITGNHVNITGSEFKNCSVDVALTAFDDNEPYGGAVYVLGNYTNLLDCTFENCTAIQGGIAYIYGDNTTVNNASCNVGYATQYGGAFYIDGENTTISNSSIENSSAYSSGGGIYIYGVNATVSNTSFRNTLAGKYCVWETDEFGNLTEFAQFVLGDGGAIYIEGDDTVIYNATISSTAATQKGGAIFVDGNNASISVTLEDSKAGVPPTSIDVNPNAFKGNVDIMTSNINDMYNLIAQTIQVSKDDWSALRELIRTTRDNVPNIFVSEAFNETNFNAVSANVSTMRTILNSFVSISPVFNCLLPYLDNIDADLNNISTNKNYTAFNKALKNTIQKNMSAMVDFINAFENINTSLKDSNSSVKNLFNKKDYKSVTAALATLKTNLDKVKSYANTLVNYNSTFNPLLTHIANVYREYNVINNAVKQLYNPGSAGDGGAIYVKGNDTLIHDSSFLDSYGLNGGNGGAINIAGNNAGANARIINSNFTNCAVDTEGTMGGAIYVDGINAIINGSDFKQCSAKQSGGSIYIKGANANIIDSNFTSSYISRDATNSRGGAIYVDGQKTTISGSEFVECRASQDGGAIYIKGQFANVIDSNFNGSQSKNGAGLYISGNNATVNSSTFIHGIAGDCGGGIYSDGIGSKVYNSNFTDNKARHTEVQNTGGGAIFWKGGAKDDTIENCTFTANDGGFGGAIRWVNGKDSQASGLIKNCTFISNTGFKGSTVSWASANTAHITLCTFINNTAEKNGGIYAGTDTSGGGNGFKISNSTFINNKARCGADIATSVSNAIIINCNFTNSTSGYGGSMVIRERAPKNTQIINCIFTNTSSTGSNDGGRNGGGAIYVAEDLSKANTENIQIINVTIINSTSNTDGGAIKWGSTGGSGSNGKLINVTIINATATSTWDNKYNDYGKGGAIYWLAPNGEFTNVTVINANSRNDGGAIYIEGGNCKITNSSISNSVANKSGGAIYWNGANGIVSNTNFTNNSALGTGGGAIYWAGTNGQVLSSLFTENSAVDGGAVYWAGTNAKLDNSTFIKNHATNGGAVYWKSTSSTFTNNKFYNNTAKYGGGIYWNAAGRTMTNTIMMYNRAVNGSAIYAAAIANIENAVLLENQAQSYEIYNRATTIIERNADDTVTIFTYFRGGDNVLNAIYNAAYVSATQTISFRNVTYLGVGGKRNTNEVAAVVYPVFTHNNPSEIADDGRIYQTNLEVEQDIYAYAYDGDNVLQMNATGKTNYNGSVYYVTSIANAGEVNVKVYHPTDNYYTYIAFANNTKLPTVILEVNDIYFQETEYLNITVRPEEAGETDKLCPGNVTVYLNGELYAANVSLIENPDGVTGSVTIPIKDLHVNKYNVYVAYSGNKKYIPEYNSTSFRVLKIPSWITVNVDDYYYGDIGKAIIETIKNTTANVTAIINGKEYRLEVNETGHAEILIPLLDAGNYTAEAYYLDSNDCFA